MIYVPKIRLATETEYKMLKEKYDIQNFVKELPNILESDPIVKNYNLLNKIPLMKGDVVYVLKDEFNKTSYQMTTPYCIS
jgi:DNA-directed RNA polymerase subunit H (RpoH/RPB5)